MSASEEDRKGLIRQAISDAEDFPRLVRQLAEITARKTNRVILLDEDAEVIRKALAGLQRVYATASNWKGGKASDSSFDISALREEYDVDLLNQEFALVLIGKNGVILWERPDPTDRDLRFLSADAFKLLAQNSKFHWTDENGKARSISFAEKWLGDPKRRTYAGLEFFPNPDGAEARPGYLNLWQGFAFEPKTEGSYAVFRDHLLTNVCNGCEEHFRWLFAWFAHMIQRPRDKTGVSVILRGGQGSGKTTVGEVIGSLFPAHYLLADDPRYLTGNFNAHMTSLILLQADEAVWAGDKGAEGRLKGLVTSKVQMIEQKGVDPVPVENHIRLLMTSNHEWVVPAGMNERRHAVFDVSDHCAQNHEYFAEMRQELDAGGRARLLHDLQNLDLSGVDLWKIPKTLALLEQKIQSFDPIEAWLFNRLQVGSPTRSHSSWPDLIATSKLFDDYVAASDRTGISRKAEETQFGMKLRKLMPLRSPVRRSLVKDEGGASERVWCYELPPLAECREFFEEKVGQATPWRRIED